MREARCLQSNNTREARSITYSTSSSSTHENSTHTDTTEATPLGRLRSPWIPLFDPPPSPPSNPTPDPSLRLRPYGTFVFSARIVKDSRTLQWTSSSINERRAQRTWTQRHLWCWWYSYTQSRSRRRMTIGIYINACMRMGPWGSSFIYGTSNTITGVLARRTCPIIHYYKLL